MTTSLTILQARLEYANPNVCIFGDDWIDRHQLLKQFKNYPLRKMNLEEGYCFHSLRHSFAMFHVRGGTNFRTLMDLMGHRNISTTLIYAKSDDEGRALSMANI
jgi:site-specific recombinase XerD